MIAFPDRLVCPRCGEDSLHHARVEVFNRIEDAETGMHVLVDGIGVLIDNDMRGNPSSRRHGLTISFWCEACDIDPEDPGADPVPRMKLCISQHKGTTFVEWRVQPGWTDPGPPVAPNPVHGAVQRELERIAKLPGWTDPRSPEEIAECPDFIEWLRR